jgi:hypothetical protein
VRELLKGIQKGNIQMNFCNKYRRDMEKKYELHESNNDLCRSDILIPSKICSSADV